MATLPSTAEMVVKPVTGPALFRLLAEYQSPAMDPAEVRRVIHVWAQCLATAAPDTGTVDYLQRQPPPPHLQLSKHTDGCRYCGTGCKTAFGACFATSSLTTLQTSTRSSAPAVASPSSSAKKVTRNARCGYGNGIKRSNLGQTCSGSQWGNCCSQYDSDRISCRPRLTNLDTATAEVHQGTVEKDANLVSGHAPQPRLLHQWLAHRPHQRPRPRPRCRLRSRLAYRLQPLVSAPARCRPQQFQSPVMARHSRHPAQTLSSHLRHQALFRHLRHQALFSRLQHQPR